MKLKATIEEQKKVFALISSLANEYNDEITKREAEKAYNVLNWILGSRNDNELLVPYEEYKKYCRKLFKEKEGV